ncbi:MAG: hypothetical protein JW861_03690 [Bacteroidales bacterium]|nr:hypothetical protein [Bacteroidales bacterium]
MSFSYEYVGLLYTLGSDFKKDMGYDSLNPSGVPGRYIAYLPAGFTHGYSY